VGLATRHGILTPYTSFMADDTRQRPRSGGQRDACGRAAPRPGSGERSRGSRAADAFEKNTAVPLRPAGGRSRKALHDFSGGRAADGRGPALEFADDARKEAAAAEAQCAGHRPRTFFRRDKQWVDSQVTRTRSEGDRGKQFSDEYFALATARPTLAQYWYSTNGAAEHRDQAY